MCTTTIGVDLEKQVFSVCSVDLAGRIQERRELHRETFRMKCSCRPRAKGKSGPRQELTGVSLRNC